MTTKLADNSNLDRLQTIISSFSRISTSKLGIIQPVPLMFDTEQMDSLKRSANEFTEKELQFCNIRKEISQSELEIDSLKQQIVISTQKLNALVNERNNSGLNDEPTLIGRMTEEIRFMRLKTDLALSQLRNLQRDDC